MTIDKIYQWLITKQKVPRWEYAALLSVLVLSFISEMAKWFS